MHEFLAELQGYLRGMWRFKWIGLVTAWFIAIAGWLYIMLLPNQYEATARVYVDTETALRPLLEGLAVQPDTMTEVTMMATALLSTPQLERVARETDLDLRAPTSLAMEGLIQYLRNNIQIRPERNSFYMISFIDEERAMAERVVQELLDTFVGDTLGANREGSESAQRFLEQQIRVYEQRLSASEDRLADFKKRNVGFMPGERGDYYARLQNAISALESSRAALRIAVNRRDELQRQIEGEEPVFGIVSPSGSFTPSAASDPTGGRIALLEQEKETLLRRFTPKHPDVLAIQATIDRLREEQLSVLQPTDPGSDQSSQRLELNPVYQSMQISLNQAKVEVASLQATVREQSAAVEKLRSSVDTIPEIEAELTRLNRDYDTVRNKYQALVDRLEQARLSDDLGQTTDQVSFNIIEPPVAPIEPVGPFREVMAGAVLVFAIGAGVALTFLLNLIKPVFCNTYKLGMVTGLQVLGVVEGFSTDDQKRSQRMDMLVFGAGAAGLLLTCSVAVVFATAGNEFLSNAIQSMTS